MRAALTLLSSASSPPSASGSPMSYSALFFVADFFAVWAAVLVLTVSTSRCLDLLPRTVFLGAAVLAVSVTTLTSSCALCVLFSAPARPFFFGCSITSGTSLRGLSDLPNWACRTSPLALA